jgi:hypothetical protein
MKRDIERVAVAPEMRFRERSRFRFPAGNDRLGHAARPRLAALVQVS